mgnify:CR=1 FL=1
MRPEPKIIKNILSDEDYAVLVNYLKSKDKNTLNWSDAFGRYHLGGDEVLNSLSEELLPVAREAFNSPTLLPSYTLCSIYETPKAQLWKHKDDNACTYTLDMCVWAKTPWDLYVDNKPYTLLENDALAYYGNDQEHWREAFPDPESNQVTMIFFHYVEPDHWWYTEGPQHLEVIRAQAQAGGM